MKQTKQYILPNAEWADKFSEIVKDYRNGDGAKVVRRNRSFPSMPDSINESVTVETPSHEELYYLDGVYDTLIKAYSRKLPSSPNLEQ